jgi:predicted metalloprotease
MPGPGKKVFIGNDYYFIYGFDKKPKLGTVIMKVEIFTKEGKKDTSMEVKAEAGMPSMRGAHETGEQPFKLSKKGDYLLPINIVMPGDWEIRLTVLKEGKVIFRGSYQFDV